MNKTKLFAALCVLLTSQNLEALDPVGPSHIELKISAQRRIGFWTATQDYIEYLEESIKLELLSKAQTLCTSIDLDPKALEDAKISDEFLNLVIITGTQTFECVETPPANPQ